MFIDGALAPEPSTLATFLLGMGFFSLRFRVR
ncbi:MAG: PEP-CTERM sorting domain-containing protein, partial [Bryobacteraceae bacterium]